MTSPGPTGEAGPATLTGVKRRLPQAGSGVADADLEGVVAAVNARVRRWHPLPEGVTTYDPVTSADVILGSELLAARLWHRRNSPAGVATFGDQGAVYVQRNDPDVALLLQLGAYAVPRVG